MFSHRFADQGCDDAFEILCQRNLQGDTSAPTSAPIQLDNGQGVGNGGIDGNAEKKFSIVMFTAVAALLAIGLFIVFFFLRKKIRTRKIDKRGAMLDALADYEDVQSLETKLNSNRSQTTQKERIKKHHL